MATPSATKRLLKEHATISRSPPPYITAHPSESNILEWHYILTGPPDTPYHNGQYWGTLTFPPNYPFAPPAIRMHTPSGRFQPSTRLCLSISDFHPKSFNPAWEVSTILNGLLSFMTSEEMTTGSVRASPEERRLFAQRSRWWNSTGGGSKSASAQGQRGFGAIKSGDGGAKFRLEWPEVDRENQEWLRKNNVDLSTGFVRAPAPVAPDATAQAHGPPGLEGLRRRPGAVGSESVGAVAQGRELARQSWVGRNKWRILLGTVVAYIFVARMVGDGLEGN